MIVRADLPLGVMAAQIVHAAGESSPGLLGSGTFGFVLSVPDEKALSAELLRLQARGVRLIESGQTPPEDMLSMMAIREPDPPYYGQLMALGLVPARKEAWRRHVSCLPKLKT